MLAKSSAIRVVHPKRSSFRWFQHHFSTAPPAARLNDARSNKEDLEYCINLVRDRDREGFCKFADSKSFDAARFKILIPSSVFFLFLRCQIVGC